MFVLIIFVYWAFSEYQKDKREAKRHRIFLEKLGTDSLRSLPASLRRSAELNAKNINNVARMWKGKRGA